MPDKYLNNHINHFDDDMLNEYLDGYLTESQIADIDRHIATCSECASCLGNFQTLFSELEALPDIELERSFDTTVLTALQPKWNLSRHLKWGALVQFITATVILLITLPKVANIWQPFIDQARDTLVTSFVYAWNTLVTQITAGLGSLQMDWPQCLPPSLGNVAHSESALLIGCATFIAIVFLFLIGNGLLLRKVTRNGSH
jgi:hypothetical protein